MLKIRFTRTGKKDEAHYRVVVAEHTAPVLGRFIEILGHYDPKTKKAVLKKDRVEYWLKQGAKPSNTAAKLLKKEGLKHKLIVIETFKKKPKTKKGAEKEITKAPAGETKAVETPVENATVLKEESKEEKTPEKQMEKTQKTADTKNPETKNIESSDTKDTEKK